jgi:signal transduction histidine kinase
MSAPRSDALTEIREEANADRTEAHLAQAHQRLAELYEISKLFASFEDDEQPFDRALSLIARTLPLRSAFLIETHGDRSKMIVWTSDGHGSEPMTAVRRNLETAYTYLVGAVPTEAGGVSGLSEQAGKTALPSSAEAEGDLARRLIVIPLVVARRPAFGAIQLEGVRPFDKTDLIFVNAIANQLAIALDRDRAWRRDIERREHAERGRTYAEQGRTNAEEGRTHAEAQGATADRNRRIAESSSDKYEALARENAGLYEQAQRAVRVREQILAVVSHDLKNPLGAILLTADALAKKGALPHAVGRIQRASRRMMRLIEDLLDFASIEAGHFAIRRQPQDPGALVSETLVTFEGMAQDKELHLTAEIAPDLAMIYCDRDRILQVLSNLVGNATKVASTGGHITLRCEARENELLFTVLDDGPGILAEDLEHLFERYWRGGEVEYKGTGLGLSIARGVVVAHGGRIWAESELGRGATFFFTVPVADVTPLFAAPAPDDSSPPKGVMDALSTKEAS